VIRCGILFAFFLMLSGCSLFQGRSEPVTLSELPEQWQSEVVNHQPPTFWLQEFRQPELLVLLEEAFEKSPTLLSQASVVQLAQVQARLAGADRWPQLSAGLASSRNKRSNTSGFSLSSVYSTSYNFSLDLSWEVDLWNRLGNGLKAALFDEKAASADFEAARLSLAANLIKTWLDGIEAQQQLRLSEQTVENFENSLQIVERGYDYGLYRALDVRLARSNRLAAVSREQSYRIAKDQALRSLEVLLGRYPAAKINLPDVLPELSNSIPAGIPAELLNRRPDIIAARERFKALDQRHIQAKKNRLPAIRLTGSGGTSTRALTDLVDTDFLVWNFASGLVQPLFRGGRLDALRDEAAIRWQQSENDYRQTVLVAFREVETLLSSEKWLQKQEQALAKTADELREAELLAREDYVSGLTDINTLLQTQRQAFDAESSLLAVHKSRLKNRVNLYLALGGPITSDKLDPQTEK
jgi:NodT family efflux transporter outer membrane factor (OMF) lipoprotein